MQDFEIIELFDTNWDITLQELARLSGRTVPELKRVLMAQPEWND